MSHYIVIIMTIFNVSLAIYVVALFGRISEIRETTIDKKFIELRAQWRLESGIEEENYDRWERDHKNYKFLKDQYDSVLDAYRKILPLLSEYAKSEIH